ncbi:acyltransferase [Roseomonas hellenica]|uniref:Acyltransferase n=1 Tax=Plastoroseomonas hellenica TaxID=2687306 RepID=A0ABS5FAB2_9PROT|nr:acyltransferase [Plastoroseomonas hellenica]
MRFTSLDAMRGAAALSVVVFHALFSIEGGEALVKPLDYASFDPWTALLLPLRPFWMGAEAVILFFVLSGLVLTLPVFRQGLPSYPAYVLKRFCRLFLPAASAVLLSIALLAVVGTEPAAWPMPMLDLLWREQPSIDLVLQHLLLLSDGKPDEFYVLDLPLWTLEVEWRISLLLPFLALLARRSDVALLAVAASGMLLPPAEQRLLGTETLSSLRYLPVFAFGVLLAKHLDAALRRITALSSAARLALWLLCILLIYARVLLPAPAVQAHHRLLIGIGAALLIALILASGRAQRALGVRPLQWLGRVSFSLYLLHMPIMLAAARLLPDAVTPVWRIAIGIGLSLVLAEVFHRLVEKPSMQAGRTLSAWAEARRARPAPAYSAGD